MSRAKHDTILFAVHCLGLVYLYYTIILKLKKINKIVFVPELSFTGFAWASCSRMTPWTSHRFIQRRNKTTLHSVSLSRAHTHTHPVANLKFPISSQEAGEPKHAHWAKPKSRNLTLSFQFLQWLVYLFCYYFFYYYYYVLRLYSAGQVDVTVTWFVDHVVDPALALLHSQSSPLVFCHQVGGGHELWQLLG